MRRCSRIYILRGRCRGEAVTLAQLCDWHLLLLRYRRSAEQDGADPLIAGVLAIVLSTIAASLYRYTSETFWLLVCLLLMSVALRHLVTLVVLSGKPLAELALWGQGIVFLAGIDVLVCEVLLFAVLMNESLGQQTYALLSLPVQFSVLLRFGAATLVINFILYRISFLQSAGAFRLPRQVNIRLFDFLGIQMMAPAIPLIQVVAHYSPTQYWEAVVGSRFVLAQLPALLAAGAANGGYLITSREMLEDELAEFSWRWPHGMRLWAWLLGLMACCLAWALLIATMEFRYFVYLLLLIGIGGRLEQFTLRLYIQNKGKVTKSTRIAVDVLFHSLKFVWFGNVINHLVRYVFFVVGVKSSVVFACAATLCAVAAYYRTVNTSIDVFKQQLRAAMDKNPTSQQLPPQLGVLINGAGTLPQLSQLSEFEIHQDE